MTPEFEAQVRLQVFYTIMQKAQGPIEELVVVAIDVADWVLTGIDPTREEEAAVH